MLVVTQSSDLWIVIDTPVGQLRIQAYRPKEGSGIKVAIDGDRDIFKVSRVKETELATRKPTKR